MTARTKGIDVLAAIEAGTNRLYAAAPGAIRYVNDLDEVRAAVAELLAAVSAELKGVSRSCYEVRRDRARLSAAYSRCCATPAQESGS